MAVVSPVETGGDLLLGPDVELFCTMQTVTSADGTRIAYEQHGDGQPLVLLHGSSGTRRSWDAVVPRLADEFALVVPDRRGRGDSGDADEYSLDDRLPATRLVELDGVGHVGTQSAPGRVADAVRSFCLETPPRR